jgi:nucleotide-binding universal stress UspA family protein
MKTILVPLNGSRRAEAILDHVERLAQTYQAKVIFLQVIESHLLNADPIAIYFPIPDQETVKWGTQRARSYLAAQQKKFREKGIETRTCWTYGRVVDGIIQVARRESVDLIAMTSQGRTGLSQMLRTSVATETLRQVSRPLLLIRSQGNN